MKRLLLLWALVAASVACERHPVSALANIEHGGEHGQAHDAKQEHGAASKGEPSSKPKFFH